MGFPPKKKSQFSLFILNRWIVCERGTLLLPRHALPLQKSNKVPQVLSSQLCSRYFYDSSTHAGLVGMVPPELCRWVSLSLRVHGSLYPTGVLRSFWHRSSCPNSVAVERFCLPFFQLDGSLTNHRCEYARYNYKQSYIIWRHPSYFVLIIIVLLFVLFARAILHALLKWIIALLTCLA